MWIGLLLAPGCRALAPSPGPVGPASALSAAPSPSVPGPGRYLGTQRLSQRRFADAERSVTRWVHTSASLALAPGGGATACLALQRGEHVAVGPLATDDGVGRGGEERAEQRHGLIGSWVLRDQAVEVQLAPDPQAPDSPRGVHLGLSCVLLSRNVAPDEVLACRMHAPEAERGAGLWAAGPEAAGLELGSSRRGSWILRDLDEPAQHSGPWLLLAPGAGLHLDASDRYPGTPPALTLGVPAGGGSGVHGCLP